MNLESLFNLALWVAGAGHFIVLIASFQVPARLNWKVDLAKLTPFNRKFVWTTGSFTVLAITSFGILTLALHDELLRGDRAALGLAIYIAACWTARIGVDAFYFSHEDWPKGRGFVAGHALLTFLFVCLASTYWGLVIWKVT